MVIQVLDRPLEPKQCFLQIDCHPHLKVVSLTLEQLVGHLLNSDIDRAWPHIDEFISLVSVR